MSISDAQGKLYDPDTRYVGGRGPVRITGTSPVTGNFYLVIPEADGATLSSISGLSGTNWNGCKIPAQGLWSGSAVITSITLSSGNALAYQV